MLLKIRRRGNKKGRRGVVIGVLRLFDVAMVQDVQERGVLIRHDWVLVRS